jgi:hypothetical protein
VRSNRTIGLSTGDYGSLPLEDRWMAHFTWPIAEFFDAWTQKYEKLEWMPAYHDEGTAGIAVWFIRGNKDFGDIDDHDDGDSENSDESYEPSSEDSDDDYDSEEGSDPYEWDSEYELLGDEGKAEPGCEESAAEDDQSKSESLGWLQHDGEFQVRLGDGKSLDSKKTDLKPEEVVEVTHHFLLLVLLMRMQNSPGHRIE